MTSRNLALLAGLGSIALLLGALGFQYIGGMPPCKMCYWQRYPHVIAGFIWAVTWAFGHRALYALAALSTAVTSAIGAYHTGVERDWWEGPTTCTSGSIDGLSTDDLLAQIMDAPLVRCDEVPWELFTLSMASWNMLASALLCGLWLMAWKRA